MTTFDDVRQYIKNGTLGEESISTSDDSGFRINWLIESDGVLTGEEQLLFILEELEDTYAPKERTNE